MNDVLRMPFDQYQRYRLVADLLDVLRDGEERFTILDVGGRTARLRSFLGDDVTLVDMDPSDEPGLVLGDGSRLPFRSDSFDVVAGFDTLEHVPPDRREAFVAECARVARRWCVLAGPYDEPGVAQAEDLLRRFLKQKLGVEHRYLDEHGENGLPDLAATRAGMEAAGARTAVSGQGNLQRWLFMMCIELMLDEDPALRAFAADVFAYYNESLYATDTAEPVYRHVVVGALGDAKLPDADALRARTESSGPGAGALVDPLLPTALMTAELFAFDRERSAWNAEKEGLREIVADREKQLEEHRQVLAARDQQLAEYQQVVERMQADLRWLPIKVLAKLRGTLRRR